MSPAIAPIILRLLQKIRGHRWQGETHERHIPTESSGGSKGDKRQILQKLSELQKNSCRPFLNEFTGVIVSKFMARVKWNSEVRMLRV